MHDDYIDSRITGGSGLLTKTCDRKFPALEDLFCLGCNPLESVYLNSTTKVIYICEDYAQYFWNNTDLNVPSTVFDSCGFRATSALQILTTKNYIIPSLVIFF